jgi:octaprenyl-diphosphate synthase
LVSQRLRANLRRVPATGRAATVVFREKRPVNDTIEPVRALIEEDMRAVDAIVRKSLWSDVALIRQVAEYIIAGGGKRLRPAVLVLVARALSYQGTVHRELAAIVEFIHTATLLHDDVVDESAMRRGRNTSNAEFGNAASVLVGDFLYSRAFQMMVSIDNMHVLRVLAEATNVIAEGEVMQLLNVHNADVTVDAYLEVVRRKTAKLFEAAGRLGVIIAGGDQSTEAAFANYGMHLGTAFQLIDDVLDYSGDERETGKNVGDDLSEGKPTLPLIYVMQHGSQSDADLVRAAIMSGGRDDLPAVLNAVRSCGALDYTRQQAQGAASLACKAIDSIHHSNYRQALLDLATFAVERSY